MSICLIGEQLLTASVGGSDLARRAQLGRTRAAGARRAPLVSSTAAPRARSPPSSACRGRRCSACSSGRDLPAWSRSTSRRRSASHLDLEGRPARRASPSARRSSARTARTPRSQRAGSPAAAARYLERRLKDGAVVAVSHGRDFGEVPRFFRPPTPIDLRLRQRHGRLAERRRPDQPERDLPAPWPRTAAAAQESLFAPAYVESVDFRDRLLEQDAVAARAPRGGARVTSPWSASAAPTTTAPWSAAAASSLDEIAELRDAGRGRRRPRQLRRRGGHGHSPRRTTAGSSVSRSTTCAASARSLRWPPATEKPLAILGALRAGIVDVLIVDEANARAVIGLAQAGGG